MQGWFKICFDRTLYGTKRVYDKLITPEELVLLILRRRTDFQEKRKNGCNENIVHSGTLQKVRN